MPFMMAAASATCATTSRMVWPASPTSTLPSPTCCTEVSIRVLISLAAAAERCARLRTSPATTAKPRPCSPARAASTAAFSARILVWKAMPSIRPMMSTMRVAEALMWPMVSPTRPTASPPRPATFEAATTSPSARTALSVLWPAAAAICARLLAVCSRLAAWASVRLARSPLPAAISRVACSIEATLRRTSPTIALRLTFSWRSASCRRPISSLRPGSHGCDRSPPASAYTAAVASRRGRAMVRCSSAQAASVAATPAPASSFHGKPSAARPRPAISTDWLAIMMPRRRDSGSVRSASRRARQPRWTGTPRRIARPAASPARNFRYSSLAALTCSRLGAVRTDM